MVNGRLHVFGQGADGFRGYSRAKAMLDAKLGLSIGRCTTFYQCGRLSAHLERGNGTSNIINVQDGRFPPWGTADTLEEAMAALKAYWESADVPIKWPPPRYANRLANSRGQTTQNGGCGNPVKWRLKNHFIRRS